MHEHAPHSRSSPLKLSRTLPARGTVQRKCACGSTLGPTGECATCRRKRKLGLQPKLRVNRPGDRYEREADGAADAVVGSAAPASAPLPITPLVQFRGGDDMAAVPPLVGQALAAPGRPLDAGTRRAMEVVFGFDFSDVRVHTGATAALSAAAVAARAYAVGRDVVFGAGAYRPGTAEGQHLIAHELTHVVQQQGAAPAPTLQQETGRLLQRAPEDETPLPAEPAPLEEIPSPAPSPKQKPKDVAFVMDFKETAALMASGAVVYSASSPEDMAKTLKNVSFPIGTLFVFAHSTPTAQVKFPGSGYVESSVIAKAVENKIPTAFRPNTVDFRGCSVGMSPEKLEALRTAFGAQSVVGSTCFLAFMTLPFTVAGVHIKRRSQLDVPKNKVTFDERFGEHWKRFASKDCILSKSRDDYFAAGGYFVSVFANKTPTLNYDEDSVCYKDLPTKTLTPKAALASKPAAAGPCTLVHVAEPAPTGAEPSASVPESIVPEPPAPSPEPQAEEPTP
jgi:hypothetical protein